MSIQGPRIGAEFDSGFDRRHTNPTTRITAFIENRTARKTANTLPHELVKSTNVANNNVKIAIFNNDLPICLTNQFLQPVSNLVLIFGILPGRKYLKYQPCW